MGSILSLRHYSHDQIVHSHDHAQLVLGLSGCLEFEVEGRGSRVLRQTFAVPGMPARVPPAAAAWSSTCPATAACCWAWANTPKPVGGCSSDRRRCR
ncbi:hypothetical protein AJ70_05422 [Pseudomonas aeruginosa BWH030]|nr:hypothetical protein AJ70_05422 [Pseudomonas aeruginosa BWH030]